MSKGLKMKTRIARKKKLSEDMKNEQNFLDKIKYFKMAENNSVKKQKKRNKCKGNLHDWKF